jgi:hypothetical protein
MSVADAHNNVRLSLDHQIDMGFVDVCYSRVMVHYPDESSNLHLIPVVRETL